MKRLLLLSSISLLSAVCAFAQYDSKPSDPATQSSTTSTQTSTDAKTIQGCLSGSDGNYTLTDKSATVKLTGDTSKLAAHVGHTIQVTGTLASATTADSTGQKTSSMSGSADAQQPTFTVTSFKHVSPTCSTQ